MAKSERASVDCDAGRALGCATFCCRLLVRLQAGEVDPGKPDVSGKRFVDKDPRTGLCLCLDPDTQLCRHWDDAPQWCREYDCNTDPRLQSVLRHGFSSITNFRPVAKELVPLRIPLRGPSSS